MIARKLWHKNVTEEAVMASCERRQTSLEDGGFCLACGQEAYGVEPDARNYECEACGSHQVFGDEEIMLVLF